MRLIAFLGALSGLASAAESPSIFAPGGAFELPRLSFPITATHMRPGYPKAFRSFEPIPTTRPVAIVGTDKLSADWLVINEKYLEEVSAIVFVVSAESAQHYDNLIEKFPSLAFVPMPGDESLSEVLQIDVFPILYDTQSGRVRQ